VLCQTTEKAYIHILDDMIEDVNMSAPALIPLFRSDQQLRILGVLFAQVGDELSIGDLAGEAGVAQATASREVARLEEHGLVVSRSIGRSKFVRPNWDLPWAPELRSILMQTVGVLGCLGEVFECERGIDSAFIFGSWAARYQGREGPFPRDVDVLVVGDASLRSVRRLCKKVQADLRIEVNPVIVDHHNWNNADPEPFIAQLKDQPLVPIPIAGRS
jgi:DNA-binding transcriptional ArsR family regulator